MNNNSKGWIMHLPYLIKEQIFCSLRGASLHNAHAVCSFWNTFICDKILGNKKNRRTIEKRVEQNWRLDRCIEKMEYFDLDMETLLLRKPEFKSLMSSEKISGR